ncbi:MAG: hypothetical protein II304_02675 [Bacteroidales bacterium]|nr:hypothetical protein [Bacteroidales bacterium]
MIQSQPIHYREYAKKALEWIKANKQITHKDIIQLTGCNCSYGVLRTLKSKCKLIEAWVKDADKPHKVYFYDGELEN